MLIHLQRLSGAGICLYTLFHISIAQATPPRLPPGSSLGLKIRLAANGIQGDRARLVISLQRPTQPDAAISLVLQPFDGALEGRNLTAYDSLAGGASSSSKTKGTSVIKIHLQDFTNTPSPRIEIPLILHGTGRFGTALRAELVGYSPSARARLSGYADLAFNVEWNGNQRTLRGPVSPYEIMKRQTQALAGTSRENMDFQRKMMVVDEQELPRNQTGPVQALAPFDAQALPAPPEPSLLVVLPPQATQTTPSH